MDIGAMVMAAVALAVVAWQWNRMRNLEAEVNRLHNAMLSYKGYITRLLDEVDELYSDGPQPEVSRPKHLPGLDLSNQRELNDGLPLQGSTIVVGQSGSGKSNVLMSQIIRRL